MVLEPLRVFADDFCTAIPGLLALTGWPVGLGIVGRTARLSWTARLKRLTAAVLTLQIGVVLIAWQA